MDSLQFNKIAGAVLGTIFLMFGGSLIAEGIFHSETPETPGYEVVVSEDSGDGEGGGSEEASVAPIAARLQEASAEAGESDFRKCAACHSATEDGANKIGPGLWGVVNRPIASHEGFSYSAGMSGFSEGGSVNWDYEHLDHFLENPKAYIDGTAMGFAGIRDPQDRADTIAYLRSLASEPAPLPEAPAEGEEVAAAEGEDGGSAAPAEGEEVEAAGAVTQTSPSDSDTNAQAAGTTDPDTGSSMPGQDQAPVLSDENQPDVKANEIQESDDPASEAAGESDAASNGDEAAATSDGSDEAEQQVAAADGGEASASEGNSEAAVVEVSGDPEAGANVFKRCQACHKVGEGASNGIGPELNGVLGEKPGVVEGYSFSANFKEWAADKDQWNHELMTTWLTDPRGTVQGTKMAFAGLKSQDDIDNIIAYLAQFNEDGTKSGN